MRKFSKIALVLVLILASSLAVRAGERLTTALQQAESAYELGKFEEVDSILSGSVDFMSGQNAVKAYRLLAFSSLQQDNPDLAEKYVAKLLACDPYYTAYDDVPRFADMVEKLKKGRTTMTTASKIAESVEEVPVPVTLITEEMIKSSGAKTLSDLLLLYVPGMSRIGSVEDNVAMRGVYGNTQETMLIMLDGHRMNSVSTNGEPLDLRNSMDKIKQIEVLRGPASSLYGNVALTSVVNIITKNGSDLGGGKITARAGSFNTYGGSIMFGDGNLQTDYMGWLSVNTSKGEVDWIGGTKHYIGGYNQKPAFDMGLKVRWGDFNISVNGQHGKSVPYYNLVEIGNSFTYDKYEKQSGNRPGMGRTAVRFDVDYSHTWNNWMFSASAFGANERIQVYNVLGDTIPRDIMTILAAKFGLKTFRTSGCFQIVEWEDYSFGASASGAYSYKMNNDMHGSLLFGIQYEDFTLSSARLQLGGNFTDVNNVSNSKFKEGMEHVLSAYMQLKHNFSPKLIFNGGLRYDHKIRNDNKRLNTYSPRLSLIWLPTSRLSVKGGYSYSFVDAAYLYRGSTIEFLKSGDELKPEKMHAFQLDANWKIIPKKLTYDANIFLNIVNDLVYYSLTGFANAGKITMGGVENVLQLDLEKTFINLNLTYQYPFRIVDFASTAHTLSNVPKFLLNLTASHKFLQHPTAGDFMARMNMHVQSSTENLDNDIIKKFQDMMQGKEVLYTTHQPAIAIFNAGVEWQSKFGLGVSVDAYNLFNTRYYSGGQLQAGVPSQSFNLLGTVSYSF